MKRHMTKGKSAPTRGRFVWIILLGFLIFSLAITAMLHGSNTELLNPKGFIASEQRRLLFFTVFVLLDIAIPTLMLFYLVAWRYRESNGKVIHSPQAHSSRKLVILIWTLPFMIMVLLASVMWPMTHKLAPKRSIASDAKPITIQVVALRWKWLFIYPEQGIATVNFIQIPLHTPVQFILTADETPMSSFWIPQLGGQLYAMTGHENQLNLIADTAGDYSGKAAEINGAGFSGMKFVARASSRSDFDTWIRTVKSSSATLDTTEYANILKPSENSPAVFYAEADQKLFSNVLVKYGGSHGTHAPTETENE